MTITERERVRTILTQDAFFSATDVPLFRTIALHMREDGLGNVHIKKHPNQHYDWTDNPPLKISVPKGRVRLLMTYRGGWHDRYIFWNITDSAMTFQRKTSPDKIQLSEFINEYTKNLKEEIQTGKLQWPFPSKKQS